MLAFRRLAIATPARPFAVAGSCRIAHSSPRRPSRSSVEARTSCIARMSTSRSASHSPMPLRKAARTPLTLTETTRRGRGMAPSLLIAAVTRGGARRRGGGDTCGVFDIALAAPATEQSGEPVAPFPLGRELRADHFLEPCTLARRFLLALLGDLRVGDDSGILEPHGDP